MNRYPSSAYHKAEAGTFSISPHKFQPRHPNVKRRQLLIKRLAIACAVSVVLFIIFTASASSSSTSRQSPSSATSGLLSLFALNRVFSSSSSSSPGHDAAHALADLETVRYHDLSASVGTARGWEREERVLMCTPLRDAAAHLPMFFSHLRNFTYPHHLIDLAFLVSDSKDHTTELLIQYLEELQNDPDPSMPVGEISLIEKDFGQKVNQDVESRHGFAAQASRRKLMAQARNWLLSATLRPTHSWVYWRDADVETAPTTIVEDLMKHNKDVIVPKSETALQLADTLDEDAVIVEGYAEYATWRPHLAYLRDPYGDPDMEMEIDGVGGVSILAKAKVFRSGVHFPAFSFEKHAETEAFGKMSRRMGFSVIGLPHYTIWHLYEPSLDDLRHMEEMDRERKQREEEERLLAEQAEKAAKAFEDVHAESEADFQVVNEEKARSGAREEQPAF
ncbi:Mannan polymerase II complex anp1 subunit [Ascosphaera acerosa]|nr:Mannan polymerase II complex anp1 subunit [Ascosphaera acerosa]